MAPRPKAKPTTKAAPPASRRGLVQEKAKQSNALVLSYQALRQFLGWLGFALPVSLLLWAWWTGQGLEPSISDFYYTPMGDVLVGILAAIGVFLLNYRGYPPEPGEIVTDRQVSAVAGIAAICIGFFPVGRDGYPICAESGACQGFGFFGHPQLAHFGAAGIFFLCLAIFCLWLFPKGDRTPEGKWIWTLRTQIYVACGLVILGSLVALVAYKAVGHEAQVWLDGANYVFWFESAGILAFALSWLVKGKTEQTIARMMRKVAGKA